MSNNSARIAVLIVAAGTGERFGTHLPKQYQALLGTDILRFNINKFKQVFDLKDIYISINSRHETLYQKSVAGLSLPNKPIYGGASRQETVRLALQAILATSGTNKPDYVLIHDAARPGVTATLVEKICKYIQDASAKAVVPVLPIVDTLRRRYNNTTQTENRDNLFSVQTPQAFHFDTILQLHHEYKDTPATDDAALCERAGIPVAFVDGEHDNFKITQADDLPRMEGVLMSRCSDARTGMGYDVHRLVPARDGRKLMICGIAVPFDCVLEGHSDADVGLHAITDALLGCLCEGDIGQHFSPKDARWKNADSAVFLHHAADMIAARGGIITHIDVTIVCEAPKIGPHRETMRARIAEILRVPERRISVKATTTEGLGFTGRGEGIAAQAVATVRLPHAHSVAEDILEPSDTRQWGT